MLTRRLTYFFSIDNSVRLFRRALRSAYNAVKELDAAMTETAVVTDFSVGDMWNQLPRYTEAANKLGTTTLGAYETMTLFYQQGLKTNEVFEIGTETMKMARIAGLDYADATDKMTAALRGFNMELNEDSARRVNDVYSELAAITAADTEEIATAMTKTASIADSANMEFETTAAFLSQIIETTRESAETAGTAMKTVIARFQELKKDPSLIGEVDGEVVDANKIEGALRTIGVALRNTSGQFRELDDVFLEIAGKWDNLDTNTQRYIATIAAGSRQQSRFIAMMNNYDRTMELVDAANNSAGASQRQFEKTTESLESKINKLKNAWNAFVMGITNSTVIKLGIDLLTGLLNTINKLIDGISGNNGLVKSILSIGIAWGGLKLGKNLITGLIADISRGIKTAGVAGAGAFANGLRAGFKASGGKIAGSFKTIFSKGFWKGSDFFNTDALHNEFLKGQKTLKQLGTFESVRGTSKEALYNKILAEQNANLALQSQLKAGQIKQQSIYNAMVSNGIPSEIAANIALKNNTQEAIKNAIAKELNTDVTDKEVLKIYESIVARDIENKRQKAGILTRAKETLAVLFNSKITEADTIERLANVGATEAQIQSILKLKAVLTSGVFWGVTAAVVALGAAIYGIWKLSPAQQFKEAQEAATKAGEAAQEVVDKYSNLKSSLEELKDKRTALDDLTEGTQEWKDAVFELNQQMLELMKTYPQLSGFINNEGGVLTIDYDKDINGKTFDDAINDIYLNTFKASAAAAGAEIFANEKEIEYKTSQLSPELKVFNSITSDLASKIAELGIVGKEETKDNDLAKIISYLNGQGYEGSYAETLANRYLKEIDALEAYGNEIRNITAETETYKKSIAAQSDLLADLKGQGFSEGISNAASSYAESIYDKVNESIQEEKLFDLSRKSNEALAEEYAKIMEYDPKGLRILGGKAVFKDSKGNKQVISREQMEAQIKQSRVVDELTKKQQNYAKALDKLSDSEEDQQLITSLLTDDLKKLSSSSINKLLEKGNIFEQFDSETQKLLEGLELTEEDFKNISEKLKQAQDIENELYSGYNRSDNSAAFRQNVGIA